jgi:hypothetical protein
MNTCEFAQKYDDAGFKLCVIHPGSKAPRYPRWEQKPILPFRFKPNLGVGLLHVQSRTCALDVDDLGEAHHWLESKGIDLGALLQHDDAVQIISGKENRAKLIYRLPKGHDPLPTKRITDREGRVLFELRCASNTGSSLQDVLPPTIHPETMQPYAWGGAGSFDILPELPALLLALWSELIDHRPGAQSHAPPRLELVGGVLEGGRNEWLYKRAGDMVGKGIPLCDLEMALQTLNEQRCNPPLDRREVAVIANSAMKTSHGARELAQAANESQEWPEPTPLPNALPAVAGFEPGLLPNALRPWVCDIAYRMQCPPDFVAVGALVGLSSLIGARAVIQPKERDNWQVVPNLWGLVVGRPGVKKSPALGEVLSPIKKLAADEAERHAKAKSEWETEHQLCEMVKAEREKAAKQAAAKDREKARALLTQVDDVSAPPAQRRFIVNDATVEKLGELLVDNPLGVLAYRDELYGLLTSLDKHGHEGSRSFYLTGYDGNSSYTFDRIMRGTVHVPNVCIALLGSIQPGRIEGYVRGAVQGGGCDDGLLQRFGMAVWPDTDKEYTHVDEHPNLVAKDTAWAVYKRLSEFQIEEVDKPVIWRFTPAAQLLFNEWIARLETDLRGDSLHPAMVSHLAKYRKLIPALALLFACIDTPQSRWLVDEPELRRAIGWDGYLRSHAVRLYAAASTPETAGAVSLLGKLRGGRLVNGDGVLLDRFTPRLIAQKEWPHLSTVELVRKASDLLADYGYLRAEMVRPGIAGGRSSYNYLVHPKLVRV